MRALGLVIASSVFGCGHRPAASVPLDPTATPPVPAAACMVRQSESGKAGPSDVPVRPVTPEYRYDSRGRLLYAVDQTQIIDVRRSWFSYDARDRLVHVHRRIDRLLFQSPIDPQCVDAPCSRMINDQDGIDTDYRYDEQNRPVQLVERYTAYDHQGGSSRDAPPIQGRQRNEASGRTRLPLVTCDKSEPVSCFHPPVFVGGSFRPYYVRTRTVTLRYGQPTAALPTSAHVSSLTRWNSKGNRPWEYKPVEEHASEYAYDIEPRVVTRYLVRDGSRIPERRVERDDGGRALHEARFSFDGVLSFDVWHSHDDTGRRVETIRTEHTRNSPKPMARTVETYAYDQLGRLTEVRSKSDAHGSTRAVRYEYDAGCSSLHPAFKESPRMPDSIDPVEQQLEVFQGRP
ncbi:hypothetical protein LVJ94_07005 [Pendulispora rubella]|uniref:RHS repeat protein n=1 Tax=Pendulispora rubella TaxID=2741070 RepID=A0ABZ2L890_9BACT